MLAGTLEKWSAAAVRNVRSQNCALMSRRWSCVGSPQMGKAPGLSCGCYGTFQAQAAPHTAAPGAVAASSQALRTGEAGFKIRCPCLSSLSSFL